MTSERLSNGERRVRANRERELTEPRLREAFTRKETPLRRKGALIRKLVAWRSIAAEHVVANTFHRRTPAHTEAGTPFPDDTSTRRASPMFKSIDRAASAFATATFLGAIVFATPTLAIAQFTADHGTIQLAAADATPAGRDSVDRVEQRITDLHGKLHITADQEAQWAKVAQVMRENAKTIRTKIEERSKSLKAMTAIDDLKSYRMLADEHADGLKRLIPVFETLYVSMTPEQQKNADRVFGEHQRRGHRDHRSKT
jgi:hypothetical protein